MTAGCSQPTPEQQVVLDAAAAMGGRDRILAVNTLVIEGEGRNFNLGQNMAPEVDLPVFAVQTYRLAIDFAGSRMRQDQVRQAQFTTANTAPQRQIIALDSDVAFNVAANGDATRAADTVARERRVLLRHHPIGFLRAALQEGATLTNARKADTHDVIDLTTPEGTVTLSIDSTTKLPASIVSMAYNVNLGDVALETEFGEYQEVDGLQLPGRITSNLDRFTTAEISVSKQSVNVEAGDLAAPAAVRSAPTSAPAQNVTAEEVARGIWFLAGGSHNSVLVEFADHTTLIEAPQSDARAIAVIAKARELSPKPLTEVVVSHHHFDHSGGLRAAVSEGLTVITHARNRAFFEEAVGRTHAIVGDALAKSPKPLKIETVDGELVKKDGMREMAIYHIEGNPHADTLLMVYFPRERLIVEADVFTPPAPNAPPPPGFPFAGNLVENLQRRKLRVDRVLPLHGRVIPFGEMMTTIQPAKVTQ
jgi:glyoxylase-like metal-dependent hydrolase (beta-lactamase superfamily II)